eukprot:2983843-Rhodomonas_salina.2
MAVLDTRIKSRTERVQVSQLGGSLSRCVSSPLSFAARACLSLTNLSSAQNPIDSILAAVAQHPDPATYASAPANESFAAIAAADKAARASGENEMLGDAQLQLLQDTFAQSKADGKPWSRPPQKNKRNQTCLSLSNLNQLVSIAVS